MEKKLKAFKTGEFKGDLVLCQMNLNLNTSRHTSSDSLVQVLAGMNVQGVPAEVVGSSKVSLERKHHASWNDSLRISVNSGQVVNIQLYDAQKELTVGTGSLSLVTLNAPESQQEIRLFREGKEVA